MKGLLLKDYYLIIKYLRMFLVIIGIFVLGSVFVGENMFMVFYPCIFSSMIPITLISYDEREKWSEFACSLPYSKAVLVSEKYILGLIVSMSVLVLVSLAQVCRMVLDGGFVMGEWLSLVGVLFSMSLLPTALLLPFIFKYGAEKGRLAYYVGIGVACAAGALMQLTKGRIGNLSGGVMCLAAPVMYGISWYLSIHFYEKREI